MNKLKIILLSLLFICNSSFVLPAKESSSTSGVYWGNFDPPTLAHKQIILTSLERMNLEKIYVVINDFSSKPPYVPLEHRVKMLKLMLYGLEDRIVISSQNEFIKADYQTIKAKVKGKLYAIVGQDSYEKWQSRSPRDKIEYDGIIVIPRGKKSEIDISLTHGIRVIILELEPKYRHLSSTKIREKLKNHRCIGLDPMICQYIFQNHLYLD